MTRHDRHDDPDAATTGDATTDAALDWFLRLRAEDAGAAERTAFRAWLAADPAHERAYREVAAVWGDPATEAAARELRARAKPGALARPRRPRRRLRRLAAAAAALLLVLGGGAYLGPFAGPRGDHVTATGEQRRLTLADGSRVLLDTASALDVDIDGGARRVRLRAGRAYFEVETDPARPFEVRAGAARLQVTGTAFAVAHTLEGTRVALREGALRVGTTADGGADASALTLRPGQQVTVDANGPRAPVRVDFARAAPWVIERLIFENRPLGAVLAELDRYHPGWIVVANPALRERRVTGNYRLDDPARTATRLAELVSGEVLRVSDRLLIVY